MKLIPYPPSSYFAGMFIKDIENKGARVKAVPGPST